jgi:hypothetical protein
VCHRNGYIAADLPSFRLGHRRLSPARQNPAS